MKVTKVKWKKRGNHCDNKGEIKRKCPCATHTSGLSPSRAYSPMCNACGIRDYVHYIFNIYMAHIIIAISYSHDSAITEVQLLLSCITCFHSAGAERFIFGALLSVCSSTLMCYLKICISWFLDVHQPVHDNLVHRRLSSLPNIRTPLLSPWILPFSPLSTMAAIKWNPNCSHHLKSQQHAA